MKFRLSLGLFLAGILVSGCISHRATEPPPTPPPITLASTNSSSSAPIITPDTSLSAKVVKFNSVGRFVVLSFPVSEMPQVGQTFFLYQAGVKVGQVKITGPQRDSDIVADLTDGVAQEGDDVRDQ
jgi:hypothetical protein